MEKLKNVNKKVVAVTGVLLGALTILGIRFATYAAPVETHYHANFAVYVNGERELFNNPLIYEEINSCKVQTVEVMTPGERAHLHDNVNDVVHVEGDAVTWGNFFQNIGWAANNRYIDTSEKILTSGEANKITFILNGEEINDPTTRTINSKDRLLVSYGPSTKDELKQQYESIATTAEKYNTTKDPASCSGGHSENGFKDRMMHLFR